MEPLTKSLRNWSRRDFCRIGSLSTLGWLASGAMSLANTASNKKQRPKSLIVLWMNGGPSQFETFDPHPGTKFGGPTQAIDTSVSGIRIAEGLPRVAEQMESISLIRSMMTKEGDHDRGRYLMTTGYRPNPSIIHPSIGSICAKHLPDAGTEIPRYVSIMAGSRSARGGYLGEAYDPFQIFDPKNPVPDAVSNLPKDRFERRMKGLDVIEAALGRRNSKLDEKTLHNEQIRRALAMMSSAQLEAFKIDQEPSALVAEYGDSAFGRGCLCARRLVEVGVPCVEVMLPGWDTHANNFSGHVTQNQQLDPGFAALVKDLRQRDMLDSTVVLCTGEFGRTPQINPLDGRDHWPGGFSLALAGGGIPGGRVIGATDPEGKEKPTDPVSVDDLFATVLSVLGIDPRHEHMTPIGRPMRLSEGKPLAQLTS